MKNQFIVLQNKRLSILCKKNYSFQLLFSFQLSFYFNLEHLFKYVFPQCIIQAFMMKTIYFLLHQIFFIVGNNKKVILIETEDGKSTAVEIRKGMDYNKEIENKGQY